MTIALFSGGLVAQLCLEVRKYFLLQGFHATAMSRRAFVLVA
jgi:hypothetical protein